MVEKCLKISSLIFVQTYQVVAGPIFGGACRFEPSCSQYAVEALNKYSFFKAWKLIVQRLLRCRPGGNYGFDPVPESHVATKCCHG